MNLNLTYDEFLYGSYRNLKFTNIYHSVDDFVYDYNNIGIPPTISTENINVLYFLLYSKYGNSTIASCDLNQFKYKLFSIIWEYGPTWEKRLQIQSNLRSLTTEEIQAGSFAIYNHAYNPSSEPSTSTIEELPKIDAQNTTRYKKSPVEAYAYVDALLRADVTEDFLYKFKNLFLKIVAPEMPLYYITEED